MSRPGSWQDWPPARPIRVDGGIKARSKRGAIGEQWWSRRFIGVLESYGMSGRLARGRSYARAGQVLDFELSQGKVTARVQGSRVRPYQVRIGVLPLTTAQWRRVMQQLASQALFRAKLLAGEMPHEIEEVFSECGTPLFPRSAADLDMHCSCPDWGVPCKHLAAVCYVLAEEFDRDPFAMLAWRGKGRDELLTALRQIQGRAARPRRRPGRDLAGRPGRAGPSAGRVPGRVLVARAEPGPAAGAGRGARLRGARLAAAHVPPAARAGQGEGPSRRAGPRLPAARRGRPGTGRRARLSPGPPPDGAQTRSMASGRPHQPSGVSRSSSSIAPSTCHSEVTGRNRPSMVRSSNSSSSERKKSSSSSRRPRPRPRPRPRVGRRRRRLRGRSRARTPARSAADADVPGPPSTSAVIAASQSKWSMAQMAASSLSASDPFAVVLAGPAPVVWSLRGRHPGGQPEPQLGVVGGQVFRAHPAALDQQPARPAGPGDLGAQPGAGPAQVLRAAAGGHPPGRAGPGSRPAPRRRRRPTRPGTPRPSRRAARPSGPGRRAAPRSSTALAARCRPGRRPDRPRPADRDRSRPRRAAPRGG